MRRLPSRGRPRPFSLLLPLAGAGLLVVAGFPACGGDGKPATDADAPVETLGDTLSLIEQQAFSVDLDRYPEMGDGRLDTVDMLGEADGASWHVQAVNYTDRYVAMTYATWYTGPDSVVLLAVDGPPHLEDDRGNVYRGILIPDNPRFKVQSGTTAVGVYVFQPAVNPAADSLTLFVNDSTAPVLRVGPFGVRHDATGSLSPVDRAADGRAIEIEAGD